MQSLDYSVSVKSSKSTSRGMPPPSTPPPPLPLLGSPSPPASSPPPPCAVGRLNFTMGIQQGRRARHWQGRGGRGGGGEGGVSGHGRLPGPPGPLGGGARSGPPSGRDLQGRGGVLAAAWPWLSGWVVRSLPGGGEGGEGGNEAFTTEIGSLLHVTANTADYDFEPSITTDCKFVQLITTDYYRLLHHYSSIATELLQYYCKLC
jgi:hypothetical protein